jgi:phosphoribosylamine--glycine ligase/phosphoribosylformylglycinamidine cyclo-ligase
MNILVVGSGGREASIIKKLITDKYSANVNDPDIIGTICCAGTYKNPYIIEQLGINNFRSYKTIYKIYDFCKEKNINVAVIGSENMLVLGIVNYLEKKGISCIGPSAELAKLETDKAYARYLMDNDTFLSKFNPKYKVFNGFKQLKSYIDFTKTLDMKYVIKPTGLCSGKGVMVSEEHFKTDLEGLNYCYDMFQKGSPFLIEEKIIGDEFTLMSYTDGISFSHMPVVQDFKRLGENNTGPNTGSMGCISYNNHSLPFLTENDIKEAQAINQKIIEVLQKDVYNKKLASSTIFDNFINGTVKVNYKGIIYGSFIKCKETNNIKVIEFNVRYGDPECIHVMELLETNLMTLYKALINKTLSTIVSSIKYKTDNMVSKYVVPNKYPKNTEPWEIGSINKEWYSNNKSSIIMASVNLNDKSEYKATHSRTFIYFKKSNTESISELSTMINLGLNKSWIQKLFKYRRDIGIDNSITYESSGVNIDNATTVLEHVKESIKDTYNSTVLGKYGDFAGMIKLNVSNYKEPILVSSIDGVGTKTSFLYKYLGDIAYDIVGKDIVNHSVNDILVQGAEPLYFLDYIASSKLEPTSIKRIIKSMAETCKLHNCPLIGGETAEMPDIYKGTEIDIVGCMTGILEKSNILNGKQNIKCNDVVIGLPSQGLHTNGFSFIRNIFKLRNIDSSNNKDFMQWISQPHKSYYSDIKLIRDAGITICGLCHITGGGLIDNPPRITPVHLKIELQKNTLMNNHFKWIQTQANINEREMYRSFNCGIGMMIIVPSTQLTILEKIMFEHRIDYKKIGVLKNKIMDEEQVQFV